MFSSDGSLRNHSARSSPLRMALSIHSMLLEVSPSAA
jgi:hypothetical protein